MLERLELGAAEIGLHCQMPIGGKEQIKMPGWINACLKGLVVLLSNILSFLLTVTGT